MADYDLGSSTGLSNDEITKAIKSADEHSTFIKLEADKFSNDGYLVAADGSLSADASNSVATNFTAIDASSSIVYTGSTELGRALVCFYDISYGFIESYVRDIYQELAINEVITVPAGASYFRATGMGSANPEFTMLHAYVVKSDFLTFLKDPYSTVNQYWDGWNRYRWHFGLNTASATVPTINKGMNISNGTMICSGDKGNMRWGYHVFEGYADDEVSRITMLLNKHEEEGKALAELYYYLDEYNHHENAYGYFKIGSDVAKHSFMFSRDVAVSFGAHDFRNVVTFARIAPSTDLDSTYNNIEDADNAYEPENDSEDNAKCVLYLALLNAVDGATFYDTERDKLVTKVGGAWHDVTTTPTGGIYP